MFCIDIDGTIATDNPPRLIEKCNRYFNLGLSEPLPTDWMTFLETPEVRAEQSRVGMDRWAYNLKSVKLDPGYQRSMVPVEGAVQALTALASHEQLWYVTCRKTTFSTEWNEKMSNATIDWLTEHMPHGPIALCTTPAEKLSIIAQLIEDRDEAVVLIDDSYAALIEALPTLSEHDQALLKERCTLVALWASEAPETPLMHTIALPDWQHVDRLFVAQSAA
jgi:hypothetical protein